MNFKDYELKDFIQDESFQNWVHKTAPHDVLQWNVWIENNPHKKQIITEAAAIIRGIDFKKNQVSRDVVDGCWQELMSSLASNRITTTETRHQAGKSNWVPMVAVWAGLLLIAVTGFYLYTQARVRQYETGYGEMLTVVLPDKSTVVLNSNSRLKLATDWDKTRDREVWLEGEAFFSVVKKPGQGNARFLVHLNKAEIDVVGTKFNATSRKACTRVVLTSGKVRLNKQGFINAIPPVIMQPGEMAELATDKKVFIKKKVNPAVYSAWIHKKLVFDDTSIAEIAALLQDNYGFQVKLGDPVLADRKLTGEIYVEDVETLLNALSKSFKLTLTQNANVITISSTTPN